MLILSCKVGQRIVLPTIDAEILVVAVKGRAVRLGVSAPADVAVHRLEVWRQPAPRPFEADANAR
jgi:carbon storage regulator